MGNRYRPKYLAFRSVYSFHFSGKSSSAKIADTGQTGTQAPQSMHSTGSIYNISSSAYAGESFLGWIQSTGQASTQAVSLVPMHGSAITYAIEVSVSLRCIATLTEPVILTRIPTSGIGCRTFCRAEKRGLRWRPGTEHHRFHEHPSNQPTYRWGERIGYTLRCAAPQAATRWACRLCRGRQKSRCRG